MLVVIGWILLHFYDCWNIITLWQLYAPVKCIAITCEDGWTPNRYQAIAVIKCADVCIKAPQKTVCWKFSHNCGTLNVPRFYDVTTILVEREMYWRYAILLMLMTGLWSRNVKTQFVSGRNSECILWPESDAENVLLWTLDILRSNLNGLFDTKQKRYTP